MAAGADDGTSLTSLEFSVAQHHTERFEAKAFQFGGGSSGAFSWVSRPKNSVSISLQLLAKRA